MCVGIYRIENEITNCVYTYTMVIYTLDEFSIKKTNIDQLVVSSSSSYRPAGTTQFTLNS
jgi:hypothetical protein